jgi:NhaA family Na+:H+ antiporter
MARLTTSFKEFFENERAGGIVLIICTVISLLLANSSIGEYYMGIWHFQLWGEPLEYWINDGLMAIFFLLVGLELKREISVGELSSFKKASLPIFGAIGGMLVPALIYVAFNIGKPTVSGFGIPMATDIAFAIGILSLLGNRVPLALKVFLMALAVIDDLGAILIIAFFYTTDLIFTNLFISLGIFALLMILNRAKVKSIIPYIIGGIAMWYFMLHSGVHATITGVLLAFAIPTNKIRSKSLSEKAEDIIHEPVAFFILPLFALANTSIIIDSQWTESLVHDSGIGILAGLFVGKPIGIMLVCYLAVALGISALPKGIKWKHLLGVGMIAGIGFTMSIFVTILAFSDVVVINHSKIAILVASLLSALAGYFYLNFILKTKK